MRDLRKKEIKISYWAAHATTIITVTMVLLIVGLIMLCGISARQETRRLRESLEISVIMADSVSDASAASLAASLRTLPFCRNTELISKKQAMEIWKEETGEDLEALFGVNPLSPEIYFTLPEAYSRQDSISAIEKRLLAIPGVESVASPDDEIVGAMNSNLGKFSAILGGIALVMLVISAVLINNTVHLTIHSRRFLIHTMQLVGATNGFIRRPIVLRNLYAGLLAGAIAALLLGAAIWSAPEFGFSDIQNYVSWQLFGFTSGALVILGGSICALAALIATGHYLKKDYHQLVLAS